MKKLYQGIVYLFVSLVLTFLSFSVVLAEEISYPEKPKGFITDEAKILGDTADLEQTLLTFEKETSNEIAVLTINSLQGGSIEDYAVKVFEKWGVGKKGKDNGVLVVIAKEDRAIKIEVGYGLEGALPDSTAKLIIENEITPLFKQENYHDGLKKGLDAIMLAAKGEYKPSTNKKESSLGGWIGFGIFLFVLGLIILSSIFGRKKTKDRYVNRNHRGGGTGFWSSGSSGGSSFGGSSGGSGFGGFGGGSSGGGGASGKW